MRTTTVPKSKKYSTHSNPMDVGAAKTIVFLFLDCGCWQQCSAKLQILWWFWLSAVQKIRQNINKCTSVVPCSVKRRGERETLGKPRATPWSWPETTTKQHPGGQWCATSWDTSTGQFILGYRNITRSGKSQHTYVAKPQPLWTNIHSQGKLREVDGWYYWRE